MSTLVNFSNSMEEEAAPGTTYAMPSTPFQRRVWNLERMAGPDSAWNVAVRFRLSGTLDREALEGALQLLTARHEALRTSLDWHDNAVVERIAPGVILPVEWCDLRSLSGDAQSEEVLRLSLAHARQLLPLTVAPLFRVRILRLADDENLLLWNAHHSICDGSSVGLLATDLMQCYGELVSGRTPALRNSLEYADYAVWLESERGAAAYEKHGGYWKQQLSGLDVPKLPSSWRNSDATTAAPVIHSTLLPRSLTDRMAVVAQNNGATFFHAALAAFAVLLRSQQQSAQVALGTPLSGRDQSELESVVGSFINYLPLRFQVEGEISYSALLQTVRDRVTDSFDHAQFRYEDMLADLQKDGIPVAESNLFSAVFICQQDFVRPIHAAGVTLTAVPSVSSGALRPLTVFMVERADGWRLSCEVDGQVVSSVAGQEILDKYKCLLTAIAAHADDKISSFAESIGFTNEEVHDFSGDGVAASSFQDRPLVAVTKDIVENAWDCRRVPASEAQVRFWTLNGLNSGDASFDLRIRLDLSGALNVDVLIAAAKQLIQQHEILRTTFEEKDSQVWQVIHPQAELDFRLLVPDTLSPDSALFDESEQVPFSLATGPLFRIRLVRLERERHWLGITLSHTIADGWSSGLFLELLRHAYEQRLAGSSARIEPSPVQFSEYVNEERSLLDGPEKERRLAWWNEQLQGSWKPLALPRDIASPVDGASPGSAAISCATLPSGAVLSARRLARECDATLFAVFGAAFQVLLSRYSGEADILFLTPFANRTVETESVIGPLANPVCLTGHIAPHTTFRAMVMELSRQSMDAMEHSLPLSLVAPLLDMRVIQGHHPLNQVTFFQQRAFVHDMQWGELRVKSLPDTPSAVGSEWQLGVIERTEGISVELLYDATLYSRQTMKLVGQHYARLLTLAALEPDLPMGQLQILTPEEMDASSADTFALPVIQSLLPRSHQSVRNTESLAENEHVAVAQLSMSQSEQDLLRIWRKLFKAEDIEVDSNFFDLGGYSLLLAKLQIALKKEFNVQLTVADVFRQPTIATLAQWLDQATLAVKPQASHSSAHNPRIIPIQPEGAGRPLFVISQSMIFRTLASELGQEQPVYAIQMSEEDTSSMTSASFDELTDFYVRLIREVQPTGPYRLAGWCVSGWIAYGIATRLEQQGEEIELLMIIDAWAPGYWGRESRIRRTLMQAIYRGQRFRWVCRRLGEASAKTRNAYISRSLHGMAAAAARNLTVLLHRWHLPVQVRLTEEMRRGEQLEYTASRAYQAGSLKGNVVLFRSEEQPKGPMLAPDMGWGKVIGRAVQVQVLPGDHHEIFDLPGAQMMAVPIKEMLGISGARFGVSDKQLNQVQSAHETRSAHLIEG